MQNGWVKLHRQILESEIWLAEKFSKGQAWVDLLLLANHKTQTIFIRGVEIKIERGQLAYSQLTLSKRWKWNRKTVMSYLYLLENRQMIHTKTDNVTTRITIINYSKYQATEDDTGHQNGHQNGQQKDTKTDTNKNDKNVKNINTHRQSSPADPQIKEFIDYAFETFKNRFGEALCVDGGKDGAIVKKLLKTYGLDRLKGLWDVFMQSTDPFIEQAGRSIGVFKSQINKLLLIGEKTKPSVNPQAAPPCKQCGSTDYTMIIGGTCGGCRRTHNAKNNSTSVS